MLTQEQAVEKTIFGAGQTLLRPEDVDISAQDISSRFFIPTIREYERYRPPIVKIPSVMITGGKWRVPDDCLKMISLRPINLMRSWGTPSPYVRISAHQWWVDDSRMLWCPSGQWEIEYQKRFELSNVVTDEVLLEVDGLQGEQTFCLASEPVPSTVRLSYGADTEATDLDGVITGPEITGGEISYPCGSVKVTFTKPTRAVVKASYRTRYPYVVNLDIGEEMFLDLFAARFLTGYANLKMQMNIEGLPVNINLDDILSYARDKEANYRSRLESVQKWFAW